MIKLSWSNILKPVWGIWYKKGKIQQNYEMKHTCRKSRHFDHTYTCLCIYRKWHIKHKLRTSAYIYIKS